MGKLTLNENLFTILNEDVTLVSDEKKEKAEALADYLDHDKKEIRYKPYDGREDHYFLEDGTEYLVCTDDEATEFAKNYIAMNLRNAIRSGDIPKIKEALKEAFRELYRISPDDFYEDEIDEKIEDIDFIDDDDEEEIDGILERFYDICDDLSIWIPTSESILREANSPLKNATKSFIRNGITYTITMLEKVKSIRDFDGYVARWKDSSDNGFGYNNKGFIGVSHSFNHHDDKPIRDHMYVNSSYDRIPRKPIKDLLINTVLSMVGLTGDEIDSDLFLTCPTDRKTYFGESTIKTSDGKWANVGKDGKVDSGKFRTKKEADAQRKAMFANNYKK